MTRLPMHQPQLLLDELGDGRLIVGGEETNEVNSVGQAADIDGIPLYGLSLDTHDLAATQVVDHDLLYRFSASHMKQARSGVREYTEKCLLVGLNTQRVINVFHTQGAHAGKNDVVHPSAVATAADGRVFLIAEPEGVRAWSDGEGDL